jgi:hypothetical protein
LLTARTDFALWQSAEKNWLCGFKQWQDREPVRSKTGSSAGEIKGSQALANFVTQGSQSAAHLPLESARDVAAVVPSPPPRAAEGAELTGIGRTHCSRDAHGGEP